MGFERTYEELKLRESDLGYRPVEDVLNVPMRRIEVELSIKAHIPPRMYALMKTWF